MLSVLIVGMLLLFAGLGALWFGFFYLRKRPGFEHWNSREANRFMLKTTLITYFFGVVAIIFMMNQAVS